MPHLGCFDALVERIEQTGLKSNDERKMVVQLDTEPKRKMSLGMSGKPTVVIRAVLILGVVIGIILLLDWSSLVNYVQLRQDEVLRDASNQAWTMLIWGVGAAWWYSYLVRRDTGWETRRARVMWLTPLVIAVFYAGFIYASARYTLLTSEAGREALSTTFSLAWPLLILIVAALELNSRRVPDRD